ncbi:hypothetical protein [Cyanobium sp. NS01]|uniref:hypothetical protein n=1 Tax=Cyanobium sp. NS01 TaxID=261284 RepID=UPI001648A19E|nr:hypothetical protein [Cyanobium sp. NS01]
MFDCLDNVTVSYIEGSQYECRDQELIANGQQNMRQWLKYKMACEMIIKSEEDCKIEFDFIFKIRTDYEYKDFDSLLSLAAACVSGKDSSRKSYLYAKSDLIFCGPRNPMLSLGSIMEFFETFYVSGLINKIPVNLKTLKESSGLHRFESFPVIIRSRGESDASWSKRVDALHFLKNDRERLKETVLATHIATDYSQILHLGPGDIVLLGDQCCYRSNAVVVFVGNRLAPSELVFAKYVNVAGTPVYWSDCLDGYLKKDRHD